MLASEYPQAIAETFPGCNLEQTSERRLWLDIERDNLLEAVKTVRGKLGLPHLSTIVGEDMRDHFLVTYPFGGGPVLLSLRVKVDREKPEVPTVAHELPGAVVYEREIHDLFGIVPVGHPGLCRQILPEDFPAGVYPMRKDQHMARFGEESPESESESE